MTECTFIECDFHETPNIYPNLSANISNDEQFRLNKIDEIKDVRELSWMSHGVLCFWLLLNFLFI